MLNAIGLVYNIYNLSCCTSMVTAKQFWHKKMQRIYVVVKDWKGRSIFYNPFSLEIEQRKMRVKPR